jgi:hypothetical protein
VIPLDPWQLGAMPPDLQGKGKKGGGGKEGREEVRVRGRGRGGEGGKGEGRGRDGRVPPWLEILATPLLQKQFNCILKDRYKLTYF